MADSPEQRVAEMFGYSRVTGPTSRRGFLGVAGVTAAGVFAAGCGSDNGGGSSQTETQASTGKKGGGATIDFSDIFGILNYAYALEQLEAAFYAKVNENPPSDFTDTDTMSIKAIGAHEIVHRDFFKAVLADKAIADLEPDFSKVDFTSRDSVLSTASTFENLGVWAYNGAGPLIKPDNALKLVPIKAAGEIVSVEARHAAVIDSIKKAGDDGSFAPEAFDKALSPSEVLPKVQPFIKTKINATNVPS